MNNKNIDMEPPLKKTKEDDKPLDEFAALRKAYRANRKKIMVSCSHVYCHPNFCWKKHVRMSHIRMLVM